MLARAVAAVATRRAAVHAIARPFSALPAADDTLEHDLEAGLAAMRDAGTFKRETAMTGPQGPVVGV